MGNIDEKRLSALLERIGNIKAELEALENEVRGLGEAAEAALLATEPISPVTETTSPVTEPVEVTAASTTPVTELVVRQGSPTMVRQCSPTMVRQSSPTTEETVPTEVSSDPIEEVPIDIDIPDIDIPPIIEDPAAEYHAVSALGQDQSIDGAATDDIPATEPTPTVIESASPATESTSPVIEPVEVTAPAVRQDVPTIENLEPAEAATSTEIIAVVTEPAEVAVETNTPTEPTALDDLPFDDDLPDDEPSAVPESTSAPVSEPIQEPTLDIEPEIVIKPTPEPESEPKPKTAILDSRKAETAVMDVMAEKQAWRTDRPGSQVKNVISAISLNDRVLLINVLFKEDPLLFQNTISAFNGMTSLDEALSYIQTNFPDWDLNSEPVYRLMMAVRRKLR